MSDQEIRIPEGKSRIEESSPQRNDTQRFTDAEKFGSLKSFSVFQDIKPALSKHSSPESILADKNVYNRQAIKDSLRQYVEDEWKWDDADIPPEYQAKIDQLLEKFMQSIEAQIKAHYAEDKKTIHQRAKDELASKMNFFS